MLRCVGERGRDHTLRDCAARMRSIFAVCILHDARQSGSQKRQLAAQLIEDGRESLARRVVCRFHFGRRAKGFHDQVDRTVLQVQAVSVGEPSNLGAGAHFFFAFFVVPA
jgi:hypothetical protein